MGRFFKELRRRRVFGVAVLYIVAAWVAIQVVDLAMEAGYLRGWSLRNAWNAAFVGFPLALIVGWFYDITRKGIVRTLPADASAGSDTSLRKYDYGLLLTMVIVWAASYWLIHTPPAIERSIAVLPFENRGHDPENEHIAFGVQDDLLVQLQQLQDLKVIAQTSVSRVDRDLPMPEIGRQLGAAFVMTGSVERVLDRVRVRVTLVDAERDQQAWAGSYERAFSASNLFGIRRQIAGAISDQLQATLSLSEQQQIAKRPTENTEAYEAYLRGRYLVVQRTRISVEGAIREFENAVELDPNYALAHAELALAFVVETPYTDPTFAEAVTRIAPSVERALSLDPTLAEAHAAAGWLALYQSNPEESLSHFEKAIQINPNYSIVYTWMAGRLAGTFGRYKESFAMLETARQLDPTSITILGNYIWVLLERNRLAEADQELEKLASIAPRVYLGRRGQRLSVGGKWANTVLGQLDALQLDPLSDRKYPLAYSLAVIGLEKEALAVVALPAARTVGFLGISSDWAASAEAFLDENEDWHTKSLILGPVLAGAGNYTRARPLMEYAWQHGGRRVAGNFHVDNAAALIAIRRSAGDEEGVDELLAAIRDDVRRRHDAGMTGTFNPSGSTDYADGLAAFLSGERKRGLTLIAKAAEDGYLVLPNEAYLQALYDDPDFAPILAGQQARRKRERDRFLATVCTDNPYAAVWQPAEGTCEQFAGAGGN